MKLQLSIKAQLFKSLQKYKIKQSDFEDTFLQWDLFNRKNTPLLLCTLNCVYQSTLDIYMVYIAHNNKLL